MLNSLYNEGRLKFHSFFDNRIKRCKKLESVIMDYTTEMIDAICKPDEITRIIESILAGQPENSYEHRQHAGRIRKFALMIDSYRNLSPNEVQEVSTIMSGKLQSAVLAGLNYAVTEIAVRKAY